MSIFEVKNTAFLDCPNNLFEDRPHLVKISSPEYPELLKNIFDPPRTLYIKGQIPKGKMIAVVGTRKMTRRGEQVTKRLVGQLVREGYIIISGMALGIDGVAHKTAIEAGGKTIAVLGAGVNVIYPPENEVLYFKILEFGGAIVSEIEPDKRVNKNMFPARNRIISGMATAVVVIEGALKSGSLITARLALEQGRDVFAVPGSEGTDYLISQGAGILTA
ncbi:DNA-protecting protein DprA [Candidatus Gottesmanbacteria bacterium]|nr:DNA-protecting protein DprA [Candidatus Gottesmanbacteria bacterium]